jgi:hypothetical protein
VNIDRRFRRTYRLHLQSRRVSQARTLYEVGSTALLRMEFGSLAIRCHWLSLRKRVNQQDTREEWRPWLACKFILVHAVSSASCLVSCLAYSSILKMEMCSSEPSLDFHRITWRYIPEDRSLHNHSCENPSSSKYRNAQGDN